MLPALPLLSRSRSVLGAEAASDVPWQTSQDRPRPLDLAYRNTREGEAVRLPLVRKRGSAGCGAVLLRAPPRVPCQAWVCTTRSHVHLRDWLQSHVSHDPPWGADHRPAGYALDHAVVPRHALDRLGSPAPQSGRERGSHQRDPPCGSQSWTVPSCAALGLPPAPTLPSCWPGWGVNRGVARMGAHR